MNPIKPKILSLCSLGCFALVLAFALNTHAQTKNSPKSAKPRVKALGEMYFSQLKPGTVIEISKEGLQGDLKYPLVTNPDFYCFLDTRGKSQLIVNERTLMLDNLITDDFRRKIISVKGHQSVDSVVCFGDYTVDQIKGAFKNRIEIYLPADQIGAR